MRALRLSSHHGTKRCVYVHVRRFWSVAMMIHIRTENGRRGNGKRRRGRRGGVYLVFVLKRMNGRSFPCLFQSNLVRAFAFSNYFSNDSAMPLRVFSDEQEAHFIQVWHDVLSAAQGQMLTLLDKHRQAAAKMTAFSVQRGLPEVTVDQCKNKLDNMKKKAKQAYAKVRILQQSGNAVVDPGDLEVISRCFSRQSILLFHQQEE